MKPLRHLLPWLLAAMLVGCASAPSLPPDCVAIGPAGAVCPLPPSALPKASARHLVTVTHAGQSHTFLGRLQIDDRALRLAGASLFGTHLFTITWDGNAITSEPAEPAMHPKLMVVMLEVALADPQALRPRLHGMELTVATSPDGEVRELYERGRLVARIERHGAPLADARLVMAMPLVKLTLKLQPLSGEK